MDEADVREIMCRQHARRFGIDDPDEYHDFFAVYCEDMPCRQDCPIYGSEFIEVDVNDDKSDVVPAH